MSIIGIGGVGIGLPYPPNNFGFAPFGGTNQIVLPSGGTYIIPAGTYMAAPGPYTMLQVLDPVSGLWVTISTSASQVPMYVNSDGGNYRLANLTGQMVGAIMTNIGSGYTSPPVVTPSAGGSTWTAIIGNAGSNYGFSVSQTVTVGTAGSGYTLPPIVSFSAPPAGGLPATGYATLSGSTVGSITVVDQGAGYTSAPTVTITANPLDPNVNNIVTAKATAALYNTAAGAPTGYVSAIVCTYGGTSNQSTLPTLTITSSSGSSAAATPLGMFTMNAASTSGTAGAGYGTSLNYSVLTSGGIVSPTAGAIVNPSWGPNLYRVRPGNLGTLVSSAGGAIANTTLPVIDGGLFQAPLNASATGVVAPQGILVGNPISTPSTAVTLTLTNGGTTDRSFITPV